MNRSSGGKSKTFAGSVYTRLENAYTIYYQLNGDFYNNGSISITGGATDIPMGGSAKLTMSVTYATQHYKYKYEAGRYVTQK